MAVKKRGSGKGRNKSRSVAKRMLSPRRRGRCPVAERRARRNGCIFAARPSARSGEHRKAYVDNRDPEQHQRLARNLADLGAELRLRDLPLPEPPAELLEAARALIAEDGPNEPGVVEAIRKFREARNKPSG